MPGKLGLIARSYLFQSAPLVAEGRCRLIFDSSILSTEFQSAPLVAEGRCLGLSGVRRQDRGFNPRPSLPRGDACEWFS